MIKVSLRARYDLGVVGVRGLGALLLKGNVKRYGGFPNLVIQPAKNCVHPPIVRVTDAARLTVETYALTFEDFSQLPTSSTTHIILFNTKKFKSM